MCPAAFLLLTGHSSSVQGIPQPTLLSTQQHLQPSCMSIILHRTVGTTIEVLQGVAKARQADSTTPSPLSQKKESSSLHHLNPMAHLASTAAISLSPDTLQSQPSTAEAAAAAPMRPAEARVRALGVPLTLLLTILQHLLEDIRTVDRAGQQSALAHCSSASAAGTEPRVPVAAMSTDTTSLVDTPQRAKAGAAADTQTLRHLAASMKTQAAAGGTRAQETAAMGSSSTTEMNAAAAGRPHTSKATTLQQQRLLVVGAQLTLATSSLGTAGKGATDRVLAGGMVPRAVALDVMMVMAAVAAAAAAAATPLQAAPEVDRRQATVEIKAATEAAAAVQFGALGLVRGTALGRVAAGQVDLAARAQGMAAVGERLVGYTLASMLAASQHSTAHHMTVSCFCLQPNRLLSFRLFNAFIG